MGAPSRDVACRSSISEERGPGIRGRSSARGLLAGVDSSHRLGRTRFSGPVGRARLRHASFRQHVRNLAHPVDGAGRTRWRSVLEPMRPSWSPPVPVWTAGPLVRHRPGDSRAGTHSFPLVRGWPPSEHATAPAAATRLGAVAKMTRGDSGARQETAAVACRRPRCAAFQRALPAVAWRLLSNPQSTP